MPWWRYGNPYCPKYRDPDHPPHSSEMLRAYFRDPVKRVFVGVGWYCQGCGYLMNDEEELRRKKSSA